MNRGGKKERTALVRSVHVHGNDIRHEGRMEQMMRKVSQHQLERVYPRRQFNKRLGLSGAEMKMFLVLQDRFIWIQ